MKLMGGEKKIIRPKLGWCFFSFILLFFIFYFFKIQDEAEGYAMSGVKKYLLFLQKVFISQEPKQKTYEINVIFYMFCLK